MNLDDTATLRRRKDCEELMDSGGNTDTLMETKTMNTWKAVMLLNI